MYNAINVSLNIVYNVKTQYIFMLGPSVINGYEEK